MNRPAVIGISLLLAAAAGGYGYYYFNIRDVSKSAALSDAKRVYASSVLTVSSHADSSGRIQRYGGEVEPLTTWSVSREDDQEIAKTYVSVGDTVRKGTKLFTYDQTALENSLEQKDIDIEKKQIELISERRALEEDKKNLNAAKTEAERTELKISVSQQENTIKSDEFDLKQKQIEREKIETNLKNTDVFSPVDGIVRSVAVSTDSSGDGSAYITIMAEGDYRVKAKLNEQNVAEVALGDKMLVYSRLVEDQVWTGVVTELDTTVAESKSTTTYYYDSGSSDSATTATNYSFYVTLDSSDNLLLGEHVYLEKDDGQLEAREGIWLDRYYLIQDEEEGKNFVWAESARHGLEKREVTLGEYDSLLDRYEITSGLSMSDYIAYPMSYMTEGMTVTRVDYESIEDDTEA